MERPISEGIRIIELETQALFHEQRTPIKAATERLSISEELHKCKMRAKIYEEAAANYTNVSSSAVEFEDHIMPKSNPNLRLNRTMKKTQTTWPGIQSSQSFLLSMNTNNRKITMTVNKTTTPQ